MLEELGVSDELDVEWLIFADKASVVQGKLYALGAGWSQFNVASEFPSKHRYSIATAIRVPWSRTNENHNLQLEMVDEDGASQFTIEGRFEVGRAPGVKAGTPQRVQLAFDIDTQYTGPNVYVLKASIDGAVKREVQFRVQVVPGSPADLAEQQTGG